MNEYKEECMRRFEEAQKYQKYNTEDLIDELYEKNKEINRLNNIINELEKWLKENSIVDYNCRESIIHEQLALNTAYEYLKALKEDNK